MKPMIFWPIGGKGILNAWMRSFRAVCLAESDFKNENIMTAGTNSPEAEFICKFLNALHQSDASKLGDGIVSKSPDLQPLGLKPLYSSPKPGYIHTCKNSSRPAVRYSALWTRSRQSPNCVKSVQVKSRGPKLVGNGKPVLGTLLVPSSLDFSVRKYCCENPILRQAV